MLFNFFIFFNDLNSYLNSQQEQNNVLKLSILERKKTYT